MDLVVPLLLAAAIGFGAWQVLRSTTPAAARARLARRGVHASSSSEPYHWAGTGDFEFEVVGESNYQDALKGLAGDHGASPAEAHQRAMLRLEDENPHDSKAVAVVIGDRTVGYLSREDARSYRRRLGQKGLSGVHATCDALVVGGGTRRGGERLFYGVRLDIKPFG